jgi:hypothetical protein
MQRAQIEGHDSRAPAQNVRAQEREGYPRSGWGLVRAPSCSGEDVGGGCIAMQPVAKSSFCTVDRHENRRARPEGQRIENLFELQRSSSGRQRIGTCQVRTHSADILHANPSLAMPAAQRLAWAQL